MCMCKVKHGRKLIIVVVFLIQKKNAKRQNGHLGLVAQMYAGLEFKLESA